MTKQIAFIGLFILAMATTNCTKSGCTDASADNFDSAAKKDDESCKYGIDVTFYMTESTKNSLIGSDAVPPLQVFIGSPTIAEQEIGEINWLTDSTYSTAPECGATDPAVFNIRYLDYTKGSSEAILRGVYGDGTRAYNIALILNLGQDGCTVRTL